MRTSGCDSRVRPRRVRWAAGSWLLAAFIGLPALAGADDASLTAARKLWLQGSYGEAREMYETLAGRDSTRAAAIIGLSQCDQSVGQWTEATGRVQAALKKSPKDPALAARLAELLWLQGRYAPARTAAEAAIAAQDDQLLARWVRLQLLEATGHHEEADKEGEWFVTYYADHDVDDKPEALVLIGQAAAHYARWNMRSEELSEQLNLVLNELYGKAAKADADFWPASYYSGMLLLEGYNKADAIPDLQKAVAINPNAAEAYVGLGIAALQDYNLKDCKERCDHALSINPRLPEALALRADLALADERTADALKSLDAARAINPMDEEVLGRIAACFIILHRPADAQRLEKQVLARNPTPGRFYHILGDRLESRRKFTEAERALEQAIRLTPYLTGPRNSLGMLDMRIGREAQASKLLDEAFEADPFNVRTSNMLKVLKHLQAYTTIKTEHVDLVVDRNHDPLLAKYMSRFIEQAYRDLAREFDYHPPDRPRIEVFRTHQYFSARTIGLPWIGTVGACTGEVIAMTSPKATAKPYHWARVIKHEMTHIFNLQQTRFNIPHWFTEALAVLNEGYPRPQVWNQLLLDRVPTWKNMYNLDTINLGFIRPKTPLEWQMVYCQAHLYAQYMIERAGKPSLIAMLHAYRDGVTTEEAIAKVFHQSQAEFEAGYKAYVQKVVHGMTGLPRPPAKSFKEIEDAYKAHPDNPDLAAQLALEHLSRNDYPEAGELAEKALDLKDHHPLASYVKARLLTVVGDTRGAINYLEPALDKAHPEEHVLTLLASLYAKKKRYDRAIELYELGRKSDPYSSKWVSGLARCYIERDQDAKGDKAELAEALETLARMDADDVATRKGLARLLLEMKQPERARQWALDALYVDVADVAAHRFLAEADAALKDDPGAIDEYVTLLKLDPKATDDRLSLARVYRRAGQPDKAREQLHQVLERDRDNDEAKKLLDEIGKAPHRKSA